MSQTVLVGKVTAVSAETRVVDVAVVEALKGKSPGEKLRVQIVTPPELLKQIAADQPVVLFLSQGTSDAIVNVADTWLLSSGIPNANPPTWRSVQIYDDGRRSFPGRTGALVRLVGELRAGTATILNKWDRKPFAGGIQKPAKLNVQKPSWVLAADVNGDKKPDLLAGSAAGTRLLLAAANGYEDATEQWGAWGNAGGYHAAGDVDGDGKTDLLLDDTLWLNQGGKFVAAKNKLELPAKGQPLAAALADVTGDQKPDALLLSSAGELRIYENPGAADKPWALRETKQLWTDNTAPTYAAFGDWGDTGKLHVIVVSPMGIVRYALDADGGPPADLLRLTGADIRKNAKYRDGLKNARAVALHMGDHPRPDLFVACDGGGLLLINRGLGTFLLDDNAPMPVPITPTTAWTAADVHGHGVDDLVVISDDGTLQIVDNGAK
jgi:hypothetical protein